MYPPETDMFLPPTPVSGSKRTTQVWKLVVSWTRSGKDSELKPRYGNVKGCGSHFGVSSGKGSYTRRAAVKTKRPNKHVRTATENQKENSRFVSAFLLSTWYVVSLCPANDIDSVFILCFLLPDNSLKSATTNKLFASEPGQGFCARQK